MNESLLARPHLPPGPGVAWALFLDIDGTLLDIAATPEEVIVPPDLGVTLEKVQRALGGALALVSGRAIASIDRLFAPLRLPTAGQHGAEIRVADAEVRRADVCSATLARVRADIFTHLVAMPGVRVEDKGLGFAVHYRHAPTAKGQIEQRLAEALALHVGELELLHGKMVVEVRAREVNKGRALEVLMRQPPFAGRIPVFVGDDLTDEDGFKAAERLGGYAIAVGHDRVQVTRYWLSEPEAVRRWLQRLATDIHWRDHEAEAPCRT
ncbi:MAG: trehalose-phosphatase [Gammaproteobacteria bacterium]